MKRTNTQRLQPSSATRTRDQETLVTLPHARLRISDGDLLLFRRRGLIAIAGRGTHSHAANAAWWEGELFCVEVREWHGGRAVTLESQVRKFPGHIDVYHTNPANRWPEYDRTRATTMMRRLAVPKPPTPRTNTVNVDSTAHCRITVNNATLGSGTLIARDQSIGLILTCAHLFDDSTQKIVVAFPGGGQFAATLVDIDHDQDLAALAIRRPEVEPLPVATGDPSGMLVACGFGPNGTFRGVQANITGYATATGATYASTTIAGAVRPGDSGGGVLNVSGQVVGVVWGQRDGQTYATCGRPVCDFLVRVRDKAFAKATVANKPALTAPATTPSQPASPQPDWQAFTNELDSRIRDLDAKKQDRGDYLQHGDLNGYLRAEDAAKLTGPMAIKSEVENKIGDLTAQFASVHNVVDTVKQHVEQLGADKDGFLQGVSYGKVAIATLGLSGPLAAAVLAAAGFVGLRLKSATAQRTNTANSAQSVAVSPKSKSSPIAVDSPPPPQQTVPETHYVPVEQDSFAKAHQWASEHVARKYPGATEVLQTQESLIKQFLAAKSGSK